MATKTKYVCNANGVDFTTYKVEKPTKEGPRIYWLPAPNRFDGQMALSGQAETAMWFQSNRGSWQFCRSAAVSQARCSAIVTAAANAVRAAALPLISKCSAIHLETVIAR